MSIIIDVLKSHSYAFKNIVYAGSGYCSELDALKSIGYENLTLIDANKSICDDLSLRLSEDENIHILNKALSSVSQDNKLNITNNSDFSSLLGLDELNNYYPAVKVVEQKDIEIMGLAELNALLKIEKGNRNALILDLQGAESFIVDEDSCELLKYDIVIVRTSKHSLYAEQSSNYLKCKDYFHQMSCCCLSFSESTSPYLNLIALNNFKDRELSAALDNERSKSKELMNRNKVLIADFNSKIESVKLESDRQLSELNAHIDSLNKATASNNKEFLTTLGEKEARISELERELDRQEKAKIEEVKFVESRAKRLYHSEQEKLAGNIREAVHFITNLERSVIQSLDNSSADNIKTEKEHLGIDKGQSNLNVEEEMSKWLASSVNAKNTIMNSVSQQLNERSKLSDELIRGEKQIAKLEKTNSINMKMLLKMQIDNDDLRNKYAEKLACEAELQSLIGELHEKLQLAASFYHSLKEQHPELLNDS